MITSTEFAFGSTQMPMKTRFLAGEAHFGVVILGSEDDVGDVAQPNRDFPLSCANDEFLEILHRVQVGVRGQVHLKERAFRAPDGGEVIVARQRAPHLRAG